MSISFESAVATLKAMFPEWDEETLSTILMSNNYHVEQTIETVLSMGDVSGVDSEPRLSTSPTQQMSYAASQPAPTRQQSPPARRTASPPAQNPPSSSSGNPWGSRNRGSRCDLPDDFLRAPGWHQKNTPAILADEELALMLQNELFQSEVRRAMGDNFLRETYGDYPPAGPTASGPGAAPRRGVSGRVQPAGAPAQPEPTGPNLGIMKALSSMGSAAKRNLTQLAQGFQSSGANNGNSSGRYPTGNNAPNNTSYVSRGGFGSGATSPAQPGQAKRRGSGGGVRRRGEFSDLDDDDEEGTEIITFSSNTGSRSQHMLQGGSSGAPSASADGDPDDEEGDSANPLLAHRGGTSQVI